MVLPYHKEFAECNRFIQDSNIKIVFNSSNSIGRSVVEKKGRAQKSTQRLSGVYTIPCTTPGCNQPYFGRTMQDLHVRTNKHSDDINKGHTSSALVQHIQSHPGHGFVPSSARLIWKTRSKYESQFVEASCIKKFSSCNVSPGEISVSAATASITTRLANLHKPLMNNPRRQRRSPLYVSRPSASCTNKHSPLQLPTASSEPPPTQTIPTQTVATLSCPPAPSCSSRAHIVSVATRPPEPASTSPATSHVSSTNAASALTYSPGTQTVLTRASTPAASSSSASPSPTDSAMTSVLPANDKPSAFTSASQPLPHPAQTVHPSLRTLPATQSFLRDHHGSQLTSFSPRRLRSDTSKKTFRSIRY